MMKFVKFALALALVVAGGSYFMTKGINGPIRMPAFIEDAAAGKRKLIEASGTIVAEKRPLGEFSRIELSGAGRVTVALGGENAVTVSADAAVLPYVSSEVKDGTLRLRLKPGVRASGPAVSFTVSAKSVSFVKTSGSGDIAVESTLAADSIELRSEGSGDISARVDAKNVEAVIAGSGSISLGGRAERLDLSILGSGGVKAEKLDGRRLDVKVMGTGGVEVGSFEEIEANIAGSGDVVYSGNPRVSSRVLGTGKLRSR